MNEAPVVVGIDVGGPKKGFHAVALRASQILDKLASTEPDAAIRWCVKHGAQAVAIDAPCCWSMTGRARPAERALAQAGIHAFATPTKEKALQNPFYTWMINGELLYQSAERHYRLFNGTDKAPGPACFETFPQAVACALAGEIVSAKKKGSIRRNLLSQHGIDASQLTNIDWVDAALCALTACYFVSRDFKSYGDSREGYILVPEPPSDRRA